MRASLSAVLLLSYVNCETIRTNYAYYVFQHYPSVSPTLINLLSELFKLLVAVIVLFLPSENSSAHKATQLWDWMRQRSLGYMLPAALYLINNLIYMSVLPLTSPSLLQVCVLAKLPATGLLHHYCVKKQENMFAWASLAALCCGLLIFNIPSHEIKSSTSAGWYLAPVAGAIIAAFSAIAAISSERLVKDGNFWMAQIGLYAWGTIFSIISIPILSVFNGGAKTDSPFVKPLSHDGIIATGVLILITAGTGLVVASLLRFKDNILKVIGTSATLVTVAVSQYILMPELRASNFTPLKVCGASIVAVSTWCYNHWNQAPWPPKGSKYATVGADSALEKQELVLGTRDLGGSKPSLFEPDATKLACCALLIAFVTLEMTLHTS